MLYFKLIFVLNFLLASQAVEPPYGQLKISGRYVTDSKGTPVQLIGMSLFEDIYLAGYWNATSIQQLKCSWNSNVIRAPVGPNSTCCGGWVVNPNQSFSRIKTVVEAAVNLGIYVIIDWHAFSEMTEPAKNFFANMSKSFGSYPNVLYEIWNEPNGVNWTTVKNYAEQIIPVIRANDPNNIIIVGTPTWSQRVDEAAADPINATNIAYTLHYYAATHGQSLRNIAITAINQSLPIFITEYGTVNASGGGPVNETSSDLWWQFDDEYKLSYVNWAVYSNAAADANAFWNGTGYNQLNISSNWAPSGVLVNKKYKSTNQGVTC